MKKAEKKYGFEPDYAVPPGETLKEVADSLGMDSKELSRRTGLGIPVIEGILEGRTPIEEETARGLELGTGVPARMWRNLEKQYQEQLAILAEKNAPRRISVSL
jgi:plasmid maintenance system antidote protein VapI